MIRTHFRLRTGRRQAKNLYLTNDEPSDYDRLIGQCQVAWVAQEIVARWNEIADQQKQAARQEEQ